VLATGGFLGGGLVADPGAVREPVLGLPVEGVPAGEEWGALELFAPAGQPFSRVGVRTNAALQPVHAGGALAAENVLVAGRSLSGFDPSLEKSGNGVAVVTGYWAGMRA
jgi:glycerol-3-phosphate dehydrogenase subunit B